MSYLLHFTGPRSFDQTVALKPGGEPVVVGRDPEAAVYLPDPERLVSRRHLSIEWSEDGARILVLSANGINTDQGDYFSGDQVVLGHGESARIGKFSLIVAAAPAAEDATSFSGMGTRPIPVGPDTRSAPMAPAEKDPWEELLAEWSPGAQKAPAQPPVASEPPAARARETTTRSPAPALQTPERLALQALCRGLGVEPPQGADRFDWERFGQSVRQAVQCLGDQLAARIETRREMRAEDRTMVATAQANPLRDGMPIQEMLRYLLFMPEGSGGLMPAQRALQEVAREACWHEAATQAAARGLAEGAIQDFDPARLRGQLLQASSAWA